MSRNTGLSWQRWIEPVDDFVRRHGRESKRWAIACTYELELATLQRDVLPILSRRGKAFRTVALVDAGVLEQKLGELTRPVAGAINLHGVRLKKGGVFHPKILLMRAGTHVRVCFGSANITNGGLAGNLELWSHTEDTTIIAGVVGFFDQLLSSPAIVLEHSARRGLRAALLGLPRRSVPDVWSSFATKFGSRLGAGPESASRRAVVVSPIYATSAGLNAARAQIPLRDVTLCTDVSVRLERTDVRVLRHRLDVDPEDGEAPPDVLHAKAYAFEMPDGSARVWTGSANFTAQALTRTVEQGGNVEILVRASLPPDEWRRLKRDLLGSQGGLFVDAPAENVVPPKPRDWIPKARATISGAELTLGPNGPVLIISSSLARGRVTLRCEDRTLRVDIHRGRGQLEGTKLRAFLPDVELAHGAATCFAISEIVRGISIPVPVNVPHVPPEPAEGGSSQVSLDALVSDILGRVAVYRPRSVTPSDTEPDDEGEDDDDGLDDDDQIEKRLDEVKHQGRLDRDAVTIAVLEKLVRRAPDAQRAEIRREILRLAEATIASHLRPVVRRLLAGAGT